MKDNKERTVLSTLGPVSCIEVRPNLTLKYTFHVVLLYSDPSFVQIKQY